MGVAVLGALLLLLGAAMAGAATSGAGAGAAEPPALVVVGAPGLAWSDLDRDDLPALATVTREGAVGSLTVRSVRSRSCAVDGWLTLSAGRRAADSPGPCREPLPVEGGVVPRWSEYLAAAAADPYEARPGTLGDAVMASGVCVETVGPGAAVAGADPTGTVSRHHAAAVPATFACPVVLVDGGVLPESGPAREAAVVRLESVVGAVLRAGRGADVVVAGVGDGSSPVRPRALVATGPSYRGGVLSSGSTRQPGVAQLQDLTATVLARVGAGGEGLTGRVLTVAPGQGPGAARVADRVSFETRAATMRALSPQVTGWLAAGYAVWAITVAALWWRRGPDAEVPRPLLAAGVALATVPVATFVANVVPWWRMPAPGAVFLALLALVVTALAAAASWAGRRLPLGGLRLVAVVTLVVLGGDVLLGSRLQLGSVFGQNPVVGGRFYGFGNTSFALFGLAVLVVLAWVAGSGRPSPRAAGVLGLGVLLSALAVEALPALGADLGGPPGLLLGGLVVLTLATGTRVTPWRVVSGVAAAALLAAVVAVLDWRRPVARRTHLGEFVETVVSGEAGAVVARKLGQNLANLGSVPLLVITAVTLALALVARRRGWRPVTTATALLPGVLVMAGVGFLVNDSGLVIPAFVAVVLTPLLVAAGGGEVLAGAADESAGEGSSRVVTPGPRSVPPGANRAVERGRPRNPPRLGAPRRPAARGVPAQVRARRRPAHRGQPRRRRDQRP